MNIVHYINDKEMVTLDELYSEMLKNKWNSNIAIHIKSQLAAVLRHRLAKVVATDYKLIGTGTLYNLSKNWEEELVKVFDSMKKKGVAVGYYKEELS